MSKCTGSGCTCSGTLWQYFFGILAVYALLGLLFIVPGLLVLPIVNLLLAVVVVILVVIAVLFALAIILKGLHQLFCHWKY